MDFTVNLCIFVGTTRALGAWRPGVLRCDADGFAFTQRGESTLEQLGLADMASVSISTHLIGADDVLVETKRGNTWSIKVSGGEALVDALRELGVPVKR